MLNAEPPVPADGLCDLVTWVVKDGVGLAGLSFELRDRADLRHSLVDAGGLTREGCAREYRRLAAPMSSSP